MCGTAPKISGQVRMVTLWFQCAPHDGWLASALAAKKNAAVGLVDITNRTAALCRDAIRQRQLKTPDITKHLKPPLHDPAQKWILGALPKADYARLLSDLELIPLPLGWVISDGGDHVNFLYFPVTGIVTLMYDLADGTTSEVALAGTEGMVGISIFMGGERMPGRVQVQSEGYAYRLSRSIMKREFAMNGKLQHLALLYTRALICQTSQTAMCNKHHTVEQQFYRWFLMSIDRLHENKMEITQALISILLGVSRESVVRAAQKLEAEGLIAGAYGNIKVLARHKLEAQACECYETVKSEYDRLLPHPRHAL